MLPNQTGQTKPNIKTDYVSTYVEAAQIPKSSGWFSSDTSLGLSFQVKANYLKGSGSYGSASVITVTKSYSFDVTRDDDGNVVLPLHSLPVVDTCPLMSTNASEKAFLSSLDTNLTFLATRASTGFSIALQEVFKLSSKLPIPNPYTPFVSLLGDGISDVVQTIQRQDSNPQPLAAISLQFLSAAAHLSGYYVLLMSTDQAIKNGFVDIYQLKVSDLNFDAAVGLTIGGTPCKNAYVVFRVSYTTDPFQPVSMAQPSRLPAGLLATTGLEGLKLLNNLLGDKNKKGDK